MISDKKAVDFYSPFYRIDIEIDGSQHGSDEQGTLDSNRDKKLMGNGVEIKRIHTTELQNKEKIREIAKWIDGQKTLIEIDDLSSYPNNKKYLYIFRLQLVFLHLFKQGKIPLREERFSVKLTTPGSDKEFFPEVFDLALDDLFQWLENLFTLADLTFEKPQIVLSEQDADLEIDLDPYSFYDQTIYDNDGIIRVRNDYFPYDREANTDSKKYAVSKNYYQVATALDPNGKVIFPFQNADASNPKHEAALTFFLKNLFGFEEFREKQLEIVTAGLHPENGVIGILPTGSGKSVCYQLVSFLTPAVSLVISPLKVLMDDQVKNLSDKSISTAERIHSGSKIEGMKLLTEKQTKLAYIAPERFFNTEFEEYVKKETIGQIAIDEVHCLSEWGHDFRTSYLLLFSFLKETAWGKRALLMGTTATASYRVMSDISSEFITIKRNVAHIVLIMADSVKRPELTFDVKQFQYADNRDEELKALLEKDDKKTLIFTSTTKSGKTALYKTGAEDIFTSLKEEYSIGFYHADNAGENDQGKSKADVFDDFRNGKLRILAATKAFGMGVDIPDIQKTIHYRIPGSLEALYQEMGRAGRNGKASNCYVLLHKYQNAEKKIQEAFKKPFSLQLLQEVENGKGYGDLYQPVWFMLRNADIQPKQICDVYYRLKSHPEKDSWMPDEFNDIWASTYQKNDSETDAQKNLEKALYKLYLLGMIGLWKITYDDGMNPSYFGFAVNDLSGDAICNNLVNHIRKYSYRFQYPENQQHELQACLQVLCDWDTDQFLEYRWNSLKELYRMVSGFTSSEEFAEQIDAFFSQNKLLDEAIDSKKETLQKQVDKWFELLASTSYKRLELQLKRRATDLHDNPFLNLAIALVAIKNKKLETEGWRLDEAFRAFEIDHIINLILKESILYLKDAIEDIEAFLYFLADEFPAYLDYDSIRENAPEKSLEKAKERAHRNELLKSLEKLKSVMKEG